jgi:hypothetical protein
LDATGAKRGAFRHSQIYSTLSPTLDLGYNPYVIMLLPEHLSYLSIPYQQCLACLVISRRIRQLPQGFSSVSPNQTWQRLYHHRAIAIREIRECIKKGKYGISTRTTYDIFALMCAEASSLPWVFAIQTRFITSCYEGPGQKFGPFSGCSL